MPHSNAIWRAWLRVSDFGAEVVSASDFHSQNDRLGRLAIGLRALREEIRKIPAAEDALQRRLRLIEEQAGAGTELYRSIAKVVEALPDESELNVFEKRTSRTLRGTVAQPSNDETDRDPSHRLIEHPTQLKDCKDALRVLKRRLDCAVPHGTEIRPSCRNALRTFRLKVAEDFEPANKLVSDLLEMAIREEVEAAITLNLIAERELDTRIEELVVRDNHVFLYSTVPLGDVGSLVGQLVEVADGTTGTNGTPPGGDPKVPPYLEVIPDPLKSTLTRGDAEVVLTGQQFKLATVLLEAGESGLSIEEFDKKVEECGFEKSAKSTAISALRKAIAKIGLDIPDVRSGDNRYRIILAIP